MTRSAPAPPRQLRVTTWQHDDDLLIVLTEPSPLGGPADTTHLRTTSIDEAVEFLRGWLAHRVG